MRFLKDLQLDKNELEGAIPPSWSDLKFLETLSLGGNHGLSGEVPPWLGDLRHLHEVTLSGGGLTGRLPDLSACTRLSTLDLSSNSLSGGLEAVLELEQLRTLNLR